MRFAIASIEDLESIAGPGSLTWRPVRAHFDIRAFGCNAYTAAAAGDDVVEPHEEAGDPGHEELYFVHAGRARFVLDGEELEAGAGTYVFVRDPTVHRHAVALEPGTTVLSFGAPPTFAPSGWEWAFRAEPLLDSDPAGARAILEDGARTLPDSAIIRCSLARLEARGGNREAALAALRSAFALVPAGRRDQLRSDLREDPAVAGLVDEV